MKKIIIFCFLLLVLLSGIILYRITQKKPLQITKKIAIPLLQTKANKINHVFVIVMENTSWSTIKDNRSAPYINSLLTEKNVSYAMQYYALHHPSEPNYVWMEAGEAKNLPHGNTTVDLTSDADPSPDNSSTTTDHLVSQLEKKHLSWKAYAEGIDGTDCPINSNDDTHYTARHIPMLFFQDVTQDDKKCIEHIRPFSELQTDLQNNSVPNYAFIIPDLCDNMHDFLDCGSLNRVSNGDSWLEKQLPLLEDAPVFSSSAVLLTWDEGSGKSTTPIGMIIISPFSKGNGYHNTIHYTHSSLVRTIQEIFSLNPLLHDAKNVHGLDDLFTHL